MTNSGGSERDVSEWPHVQPARLPFVWPCHKEISCIVMATNVTLTRPCLTNDSHQRKIGQCSRRAGRGIKMDG